MIQVNTKVKTYLFWKHVHFLRICDNRCKNHKLKGFLYIIPLTLLVVDRFSLLLIIRSSLASLGIIVPNFDISEGKCVSIWQIVPESKKYCPFSATGTTRKLFLVDIKVLLE